MPRIITILPDLGDTVRCEAEDEDILFAHLFATETAEQRAVVEEFFKKLDTPVDVAREVFGAGRKQVSTFPLVGGTTIVMGLLIGLILLTDITASERGILGVIIGIMIVISMVLSMVRF